MSRTWSALQVWQCPWAFVRQTGPDCCAEPCLDREPCQQCFRNVYGGRRRCKCHLLGLPIVVGLGSCCLQHVTPMAGGRAGGPRTFARQFVLTRVLCSNRPPDPDIKQQRHLPLVSAAGRVSPACITRRVKRPSAPRTGGSPGLPRNPSSNATHVPSHSRTPTQQPRRAAKQLGQQARRTADALAARQAADQLCNGGNAGRGTAADHRHCARRDPNATARDCAARGSPAGSQWRTGGPRLCHWQFSMRAIRHRPVGSLACTMPEAPPVIREPTSACRCPGFSMFWEL